MLSTMFFINGTFNSICWYHERFHLHIQAFKFEIFIDNIFDLFIFFNSLDYFSASIIPL